MIAYTWSHFLNHTDQPNWLARLPMTKAAVKAMDTIQEFVAGLPVPPVKNFVVAGASKRGWTTWTTGCVDKRVIAMVPMVMPILNIVPNMNHHYQAYGGWSFALSDYLDMHLMRYLNSPLFVTMADIIDPWSYLERLTMPKLVLMAGGDEFFLPDSPQFFFHSLPGENHLFLIPDAEHSLATALADVGSVISAFHYMVVHNIPRPTYSWKMMKSNTTASTTVTVTGTSPDWVTMWYAHTLSSTLRDFRLVICDQIPQCLNPVIWWPQPLLPTAPNTWTATMDRPKKGWGGFLIELGWYIGKDRSRTLKVTTEVNIVPDYMPFPPCGDHCQT